MNKIIVLLLVPFLYAADFVCHDNGKITQKVYSKGKTYSSRPDCLKVSRSKLREITEYHKIDVNIIGANDDKVIEMSQAEKAALVQDQADAQVQDELDRLNDLDDSIAGTNMSGVKLQRVEQAIDNIGSLSDAKTFLKKLVRYISNMPINH